MSDECEEVRVAGFSRGRGSRREERQGGGPAGRVLGRTCSSEVTNGMRAGPRLQLGWTCGRTIVRCGKKMND